MPSGSHSSNPIGQELAQKGGSMLKFKRAFAGRRKNKSQDFDIPLPLSTGDAESPPRATSPRPSEGNVDVFARRGLQSQTGLAGDVEATSPPPPPPKEESWQVRRRVQYSQVNEFGQEDVGEREDWRKSNSTTHTVKPQHSPRPEPRRDRDVSPSSSPSRSPSSASSQIPSPGSSHTSMSAYQNQPSHPERRTAKRSLKAGLIPDSLRGKRTAHDVPIPPLPQTAPPSSFRQQPPTRHVWPPLYGPLEPPPSTSTPTKEQSRTNTLSFTHSTLQLGKRAVEKINFKGWGATHTKSSVTGNNLITGSSNSSTSSLVRSSTPDNNMKGKCHPQIQMINVQKRNQSVHSLASGSGSDAEAGLNSTPLSGPQLGVLVRPPLVPAGQGGMVFGRDLASATRDTRILSASLIDIGASAPRSLQDRLMPALVTRCVMHLKKWGLDEEGIFRISGRQTHIQKLKAEFDRGADWDFSECSPAELDPHAVASVLRAYLRSLPDPILTRSLGPQFDAVMSLEQAITEQGDSARLSGTLNRPGPALPLSPRARPQIIRQPSLRESATPGGPRGPSPALIRSLGQLIAQLPPEHHDILQTVTELLRETASQSKFTKMPLSNLLLIFCPSLNMPPSLLRLLCQCEEIWSPPVNVPRSRLVRQRSASESVLMSRRKSSSAISAQYGCRASKSPSEGVSSPEDQIAAVESDVFMDADDFPESKTDATLVPLPSPLSVELELDDLTPESRFEDEFERPSRRHTVVARTSSPEDSSWIAIEEASPTSSLISTHRSQAIPPDTSLASAKHAKSHLTVETDRQREMMMELKGLSDSEVECQRNRFAERSGPSNSPDPTIRHVVSLSLLRTKDALNGPPSARSLPLPDNHTRPRASSKLRFSFRGRSMDFENLTQESPTCPNRVHTVTQLDNPPQLAPLLFDTISLELGLTEDEKTRATSHLLNRLSMHSRSRSSPLLRESLIGSPAGFEWMSAEQRASIVMKHDLRLPPLRSQSLSTAPKLDLETPSTADDDWLQSVLKAGAGPTSGSF